MIRAQTSVRSRLGPEKMDNFPLFIFSARIRPNPAGTDRKIQKTQGFLLGRYYLITCTPFFSTCSSLTSLSLMAAFAAATNAAAFSGWIIVRIVVPAPLR